MGLALRSTCPSWWRMGAFYFLALVAGSGLMPATAAAGSIVYAPIMTEDGAIAVIDAAQDKIIAIFPGVNEAHGLASGADGKYLVTGGFEETGQAGGLVSVILTAAKKVVHRIPVPGAVHHTAVMADGRFAIATHSNSDEISVLDMRGFKLLKTLKTGPSPNYAVTGTDGRRVYVSNSGGGTISEIDTERWTVSRDFTVGEDPGHMVLSPDGAMLYVNNGYAGTVTAVSLRRGAAAGTYEIGGSLHGIDVSDDGKNLFVTDMDGGRLVKINLDSGKMSNIRLGPSPFHLTAIHGTGKLYVSSFGDPKIWVVDGDTLKKLGEILLPGQAHQMAVVTK